MIPTGIGCDLSAAGDEHWRPGYPGDEGQRYVHAFTDGDGQRWSFEFRCADEDDGNECPWDDACEDMVVGRDDDNGGA